MVSLISIPFVISHSLCEFVVFAQQQQPMIQRMDSGTRVQVFVSLFLLVMLGCALMALAWWGARVVRRRGRRADEQLGRRPATPDEDDWWKKPLVPAEPDEEP